MNDKVDAVQESIKLALDAAIANPFICCYLSFLALKYIKRDDELVKSLDRIR